MIEKNTSYIHIHVLFRMHLWYRQCDVAIPVTQSSHTASITPYTHTHTHRSCTDPDDAAELSYITLLHCPYMQLLHFDGADHHPCSRVSTAVGAPPVRQEFPSNNPGGSCVPVPLYFQSIWLLTPHPPTPHMHSCSDPQHSKLNSQSRLCFLHFQHAVVETRVSCSVTC